MTKEQREQARALIEETKQSHCPGDFKTRCNSYKVMAEHLLVALNALDAMEEKARCEALERALEQKTDDLRRLRTDYGVNWQLLAEQNLKTAELVLEESNRWEARAIRAEADYEKARNHATHLSEVLERKREDIQRIVSEREALIARYNKIIALMLRKPIRTAQEATP